MATILLSPLQSPDQPFLGLVRPWLLQGILLICVLRGSVPGTSAETISGMTMFVVLSSVWLLTLLFVLPRSAYVFRMTRDRLLLLSLPLLALLSAAWSVNAKYTVVGAFDLFVLTVAGVYIARCLRPNQQMKLFMLAGALTALFSLLTAALSPGIGIDHAGAGHDGALVGIFTQKNTCGAFMLILLTPALFLRSREPLYKLFTLAYGLICLTMVVMSQSRTSWMLSVVLLTVACGLRALRTFRSRDATAIIAALAIIAVPAGCFIATQTSSLLELLGRDSTASGRSLIWVGVLSAIGKRPLLGYGYGGFFSTPGSGAGDLSMFVGFPVNHPHNGYLAVWLDLGLAGISLFLLLLCKALRDAFKSWRREPAADWYISVIFLVLLQNIDERGLVNVNDISWLMFVVACCGLHRLRDSAGRSQRQQVAQALHVLAASHL